MRAAARRAALHAGRACSCDENDELMKTLNVVEIPTFFVYKNGEITWQHIGLVEKDVLVRELGL